LKAIVTISGLRSQSQLSVVNEIARMGEKEMMARVAIC
jgi:hypothetical protein